ncbi:hypothetical protein XELAEV_18007444mg [Xenopus laevis]|uniref:Uncharacterized protein n=1 Tax=Xenopus laevis TaxID=8355 RepID=A0A974E1X2_XENLA|nr:hypothetical protein XELAEV_18007444mg [Xenopus laevis]
MGFCIKDPIPVVCEYKQFIEFLRLNKSPKGHKACNLSCTRLPPPYQSFLPSCSKHIMPWQQCCMDIIRFPCLQDNIVCM